MTADTIEPRALALQGIGFDALATALQGFVWRKTPTDPPADEALWTGAGAARRKRQRQEDELLLALLL